MNIVNYIKSVLPVVPKSTMVEDLRVARTMLQESRSSFELADNQFKNGFKSAEGKRLSQSFTTLTACRGSNVLSVIGSTIPEVLATVTAIEAMVASEFEEKIAPAALTYKKGTLMQLTDAASFIARFSLKLYAYLLKCEITQVRQTKKMDPDQSPVINDYEVAQINEGFGPFCVAWKAFAGGSSNMVDRLAALPEAVINATNYGVFKSTQGDKKIDPFGLAFHNFRYSPVRWIRMRRAEANEARYREAQTELAMARLRLTQLQQLEQGREDAAIDREINYLQNVIDAVTTEIEDLETA